MSEDPRNPLEAEQFQPDGIIAIDRGWCLSPAYDINPVPRDVKLPYLSTLIDERDSEASFKLVMSTGEYYGLAVPDMRQIVQETVKAVSGWRKAAEKLRISRSEIDRMASAFEHEAYRAACAILAG